ncbi:MAG: trigger factor [Eubacteriales bacterium]|nr:trigger factor [Eubacteriales bacterium]
MKKRIVAPFVLTCALVLSLGLSGCSTSGTAGPISNEFVEVSKYKGLEIPVVEKTEVTDEMVENEIQGTLANNIDYKTVDRESKEGDMVNIDFVGKLDGKAFDNGSAEKQDLVIGQANFIGANGDYKGFEEQLVGHKAGEKFVITVKFPDQYAEELAGKVATFDITLHEVKEGSVPELTEDILAKLGTSAKTPDEYREEVRKGLEEQYQSNYDSTVEREVYTELTANIKVVGDLQSEIDEAYQSQYASYESYAQMYGVEMEEFAQSYIGKSLEDFQAELKASAEKSVAFKYACNLIAEEAKLALSDKEFTEEATKLAEEYGFTDSTEAAESSTEAAEASTGEAKKVSALDQFVEQYGEESIRDYLTQKKVMAYLVENSKQTESATTSKPAETEEATTEVK